ncbi:hypothetical protein C3943_21160 [Lysinibacillus sp. B2A1]|nr:hypothetical protein C3943_21160 [Lysinibacillus sp. B2A1]
MENKQLKKGILILFIILAYSLLSITYTLILNGKINWSPFILAVCVIASLINIYRNYNKTLKKVNT